MPNTHPEDIKAAVRRSGLNLAQLARLNGLSDSTTRAALRRPQPSGNRAIANHLSQTLHAIWPEWFDADDRRISGQPTRGARIISQSRKSSTRRPRRDSQKEERP